MKKILLLFIATTFLSCGASKLLRDTEDSFKGEWTLSEITYPNSSGFFDVSLFQTAQASCFESSIWTFVSNNNRGTVDLYYPSCSVNSQNIVWFLEESTVPNYLYDVILKMAEADKAKKETQGSRLQIKETSPNGMVWDLTVQYKSKLMIIRLNFVKNSKE